MRCVDNRMGSACIKSCNSPSLSVSPHWKLCLIAVVIRLVHADYRLDTSEFAEQPFGLSLLEAELLRVAQILQLASAAFFI